MRLQSFVMQPRHCGAHTEGVESHQMSQIDFGSQATPSCVGENAQKVGPQVLEVLCFQWWALFHAVSKWRSCPCAPLIDVCIQPMDGNRCPTPWYDMPSTMMGGVNWWWTMDHSTANTTSGFSAIVCFSGQWACLNETLHMSATMPCPKQHVTGLLFPGTTGCAGHGLTRPEPRYKPNWACLGPNMDLNPRHGFPPPPPPPPFMCIFFTPPEVVTQCISGVMIWL